MKVLVIEDDVATVEAIRLCLEIHRPDTSATLTAKGIEGIELLRGEAPDVVILDLGLPDIDGIRVLEQIRRFSDVPVLIVSARDTQDSIVKGLELGAEDYIVKPFDYRDLLDRLDNVIRLSQMPRPRAGEVRIKGGGTGDRSRCRPGFCRGQSSGAHSHRVEPPDSSGGKRRGNGSPAKACQGGMEEQLYRQLNHEINRFSAEDEVGRRPTRSEDNPFRAWSWLSLRQAGVKSGV
ncbi:response regulator transcription factor [Dehalococcoidia bacterium]|nr:response regulator transcription factor [Dehalococcoidia bacterium]